MEALSDIVKDAVSAFASGGSGSPGGSNTQMQFNDAGAFGGAATITYNKVTFELTFSGGGSIKGLPISTADGQPVVHEQFIGRALALARGQATV